MNRVVVTTLSADERALAQQAGLTQQGDGLAVGALEDDAIQKLRDAGLLVEVIPDANALKALKGAGWVHPDPLESFTGTLPKAPADVELQTSGPILPDWIQRIAQLGVTRVERSGGDRLWAHVDDDPTLAQVAGLDFVIVVRQVIVPQLPAAPAPLDRPINGPPPPPDTGDPAWDVSVSGDDDAKDVQAWAAKNGLVVVGASARRVRLRVPAGKQGLLDQLSPRDVAPFVPPVLLNDFARQGVGIPADARVRVGADDVTLTGKDQIVGVADSGIDDTHADFAGRIVQKIARGRPGDTSDPNGHGTHVSGTILGSGAASGGKYRGIAPEASLVFQSLLDGLGGLGGLPVDLGDLFQEAFDAGVRIHSDSWGTSAQSRYASNSEDVDAFLEAHPEMLIVVSAGNDGTTVVDATLPSHLEAGLVQPLSLGAPATSKNALVVGATRSSRNDGGGLTQTTYNAAFSNRFPKAGQPADVAIELISGNPEQLAAFSSRGPCDDRRIKPDVVAPGTDIVSTRSALAPDGHFWGLVPGLPYAYDGGTSMAAPVVTGLATLVREYYVRHRAVAAPSAVLLKATLVNGTRVLTGGDAGGPVPNPQQGFGCVNLPTTLPSGDVLKLAFVDVAAANGFAKVGDFKSFTFNVAAAGDVRICLAFSDPAARSLQNDLDLVVQPPGIPAQKILGNADLTGRLTQDDTENNVEIVRVQAAPAGTWKVSVLCRNLLKGPQGYALVVLGPLADETLQPVSPAV